LASPGGGVNVLARLAAILAAVAFASAAIKEVLG
jgi:hypothetical protein